MVWSRRIVLWLARCVRRIILTPATMFVMWLLRRVLDNDPGKLLEFVADEKNYVEAVKLGLVVPAAADEPPIVAVEGSGEPVEAPSASSP